MKRNSIHNVNNAKKKNIASNRSKPTTRQESSLQYEILNSEINLLLRSINMNFDFKNFRKAKLQSIEIVIIFFIKNIFNSIVFFSIKKGII
jgi:hypothetical protein